LRALVTFTLIVCTHWALAQSYYQREFGDDRDERAVSAIESPAGGFVVAGVVTPDGGAALSDSLMVVQLDADGNQVWRKHYEGRELENHSIELLPHSDGGYYLLASKYVVTQKQDLLLHKLSASGALEWSATLERGNSTIGVAQAMMLDDGSILASVTCDSVNADPVVACVRLDAMGNQVWWQELASNATASAMTTTDLGGSIFYTWVTGRNFNGAVGQQTFLQAISEDGVLFGSFVELPGEAGGLNVKHGFPGSTYVLTKVNTLTFDSSNYVLIETDGVGNIQQQPVLNPGEFWRDVQPMAMTPDLDLILAGTALTDDFSDWEKGFFQQRQPDATIDWNNYYGFVGTERFRELFSTSTGDLFAAGCIQHSSLGRQFFVVHANESGIVGLPFLQDKPKEHLWLTSPNPCRQHITITSANRTKTAQQIKLLNLYGQQQQQWTSIRSGSNLELRALPAGIYLLQITSNDTLHTLQICVQ